MKKQGKPKNLPEQAPEHTIQPTSPKGIDIEDILAYKKKGLSHSEIGKVVGCSEQNVSKRIQSMELESLSNFRDNKDHVFEHLQRKIVKSIGDGQLNSMSGLQLITGAAILQDKIQVIRGLSSEIVDHRVLTLDLNKAIEQLRQEQGIDDRVTNGQNEQIIDVPECP